MSSESLEPYVDPVELAKANAACDAELARYGLTPNAARVRTGWRPGAFVRSGKLTDKKIAEYAKAGFYSAEYKAARKKAMDKKKTRSDANFVERDGRLIYSPN